MIRAKKRFGQNFLKDQHIIDRIVHAIHPQAMDHIVEIGPGLGALTQPLLPQVAHYTAIEMDKDVIPSLKKACCRHAETLTLHQGDALTFDFSTLGSPTQKMRLVGNLPYNISTPLLFHVLSYADSIQDMHFMLQKEVVDRIVATPGHKTYGRLSVMLQYYCKVTECLSVPPEAFKPIPKVDSAVIRCIPHPTRLLDTPKAEQHLEAVVKQAFSQRRKTIKNTLKKLVRDDQWTTVDLDPGLRAEALSVNDFVRLTKLLANDAITGK